MSQERKENFNPERQERVKIEVSVKNLKDPINDLICANCLLYANCSAACEHLDEVYSRIGQEFHDDRTVYDPEAFKTDKRRDIIRERIIHIVNEYLKEKEICYGNSGDT